MSGIAPQVLMSDSLLPADHLEHKLLLLAIRIAAAGHLEKKAFDENTSWLPAFHPAR